MKPILVLWLLICLALPAHGQEESLTVVAAAAGLEGMVDRHLTRLAEEHWKRREAELRQVRSPEQVRRRQKMIRAQVLQALGGFPTRTPLRARVTGTLEREGYRVEKVVFESLPNYYVTANVYVPATGRAPYPAVLGAAGHSAEGKASPIYQHAWISLARRGFIVLAFDPMGQGERSEYLDPISARSRLGKGGTQEHNMAGLQCLLTGTHYARYELWDAVRAVDYLATRADVDRDRIAVAGNSGGGTQAAYLAVVEPRLSAVVSSCYMSSWETLWQKPGPQDAEQNFPDFVQHGLDFSDFAIAFAPRPFKILSAARDYFPIAGARAAFADARRIYDVLGQADRIDFFEYDDTHGWSRPRREATYVWMEKWLYNKIGEEREKELTAEPEQNLYATKTGQVQTSLRGETVQSLNQKLAEEIYPRRTFLSVTDAVARRARLAAQLRLQTRKNAAAPAISRHGNVERAGYRIEKITLESEPGITLPALVFVPNGNQGLKMPAVLYVHEAGKAADAAPGGDIEALALSGHVVIAPDVRGWGESSGKDGGSGYSASWQTAMRALLVGKTLAGMQTGDLLRSVDYLVSRGDVDAARLSIVGKGKGGVLAMLTAALDLRLKKAIVERAVSSYFALVKAKEHRDAVEMIIPGVLKHFDLPDVAEMIAPRTLWVVDPQTATGGNAPLAVIRQEYAPAQTAYQRSGKQSHMRLLNRPQTSTFDQMYGSWSKQ